MKMSEVFVLDIGTRTIAGLILARENGRFQIKQVKVQEQLPGAMADGQIHNIEDVATIIQRMKQELEAENGESSLTKVAVAAAGRSLLTEIGQGFLELAPNQRLSADQVQALELDAVRDAVQKLTTNDNSVSVMHSYLCVGYSVIEYTLDGEPIGSLFGHQGRQAEVKIIATFLPRIVIDSLGTALHSTDLTMQSLTLEPIAAMHVVVPPTMRMLNIALVDIGAGTSDLAISADGKVKGYGMVSTAGDAITQGLAEHFLLDFRVAEQVKVELTENQMTQCQDVFGNTLQLSYEEVLEVMLPKVETLAEKIAKEILHLNGTAPKGVILIGGGSRAPELSNLLARALNLPPNLVRIRDRSNLELVQGLPQFSGPEMITPLGIGCTHLDGLSMHLINVQVNNEKHQFLNMDSSTVGEVLLQAGLVPSELVGRPGPAFTIEVNGHYTPLPGTLGKMATIKKNGEPCDLATPVADGDSLIVEPGQAGQPPHLTLGELIDAPAHSFSLTLNGSPLEITPFVSVNGQKKSLAYVIQDRDKITFRTCETFRDLFEYLQIPISQKFHFYLNDERKEVVQELELKINGQKQSFSTALRPDLRVEYTRKQPSLRDLLIKERKPIPGITIKINGQDVELRGKEPTPPQVNGEVVSFDYKIRAQDQISYQPPTQGVLDNYIITDIFRDYEPEKNFTKKGGRILLNGSEAGFTTPIKHGDQIEFTAYGAGIKNS